LGQQFYDLGDNVLIAPLPHHGLADRMTTEHAKLTAEELAAYADETVDIAQGLGHRVIMMGLSLGGATTAWAAQNRSDLDLAVIISPALGFKQIPTPLTAPAMNIYAALPDEFVWWNADEQADAKPKYGYPRYSKHALVQSLRLGFAIRALANRQPPAAKKMIVVFNANDTSINNELAMEFVKTWLAHHANLSTYEFDANLKLPHDLIDPTQPDQKIGVVYPQLIDLVNR
jgi:carboxylesterase